MRRFEYREGASQKFWEVAVEGPSLLVRFGRLGTQGQEKPKACKSAADAAAQLEKLVAEKLGKGYVEVASASEPATKSTPKPVPATRPAPAGPVGYWVRLRDGRGRELVVQLQGLDVFTIEGDQRLGQTLDSAADAKAHFERVVMTRGKRGYTVVDTGVVEPDRVIELDAVDEDPFEGTIDYTAGRYKITFESEPALPIAPGVISTLVARIALVAPRSVQLVCDLGNPGRAWQDALAGVELPSLTGFIFDTPFQTQTRQGENSIGDLALVLRASPKLEKVFACGALELTPTEHASLLQLHLSGNPLSLELAQGLGASRFPALHTLALSFTSDASGPDDGAMLEALLQLRAPRLSTVHLHSIADVPAFIGALCKRGVPASWKTLALEGTWAEAYDLDELQPAIEANLHALRSLEHLFVRMDAEEIMALRKLLPSARNRDDVADPLLPDAYDGW